MMLILPLGGSTTLSVTDVMPVEAAVMGISIHGQGRIPLVNNDRLLRE
jgi:hypothetical protein